MHTRSFHGNDLRERAFRRLRRADAENTPALGAGRDSMPLWWRASFANPQTNEQAHETGETNIFSG